LFGTGPAFRDIFFPRLGPAVDEDIIRPLTGLDDGWFAAVATALLVRRMAAATSGIRPQLPPAPMDSDLAAWSRQLRETSYRFYAEMTRRVDGPIRTALAAFPDEGRRAEAREHYLAGITSESWVNDKLVQDGSGNWTDRDWELFHHWAKLTALGTPPERIDAAIRKLETLRLPMPAALGPGRWQREAPWFERDFHPDDTDDATEAMLSTKCSVPPGARTLVCIKEDNSYEFTARSQPGNRYRTTQSSSCFAPGTRVVMADGALRAIEDVAVGEEVLTPGGPRRVILRPSPRRGGRVLERFAGTGFAFAASHPFLIDPGSGADGAAPRATYAAADPQALARTVPTLGQFGISPLTGSTLLRHTPEGSVSFPAPPVHQVPELKPDLLYDLYIDVGPDGRSEYYAGDQHVQLLVASEVPRFESAPETAAVILEVLRLAAPTILGTLADVPDESFDDVLAVGLDAVARTLMADVGPHLHLADAAPAPEPSRLPAGAADLAAAVRAFAAAMSQDSGGYDRRMGVLVEQFAARFAPQFQAALAVPWRTFDLAEADVAGFLSVTLYSIELFQPGPPVPTAEAEVVLRQGDSRSTRRLPVREGAPADRWYYSVDSPAYFPEWSESGREDLWSLEIALQPGVPARASVPLSRTIAHGYEDFAVPLTAPGGRTAGQARFDVRLLTIDGFAAELRERAALATRPAPSTAGADRLAHLAAEYVEKRFADCVSAFRFCMATTRMG
jgi:hypothetical protein